MWIVLFSQERIVLWSYPRVHCSNNFVSDCSSNTSVWDILDCLESKMSFLSLLPWVDMSKKQRVGYYDQNSVRDKWVLTNSLLPSRPQPLFQSGAKRKGIDMKIFFILMQIKLIFTRKLGFALFLNWYSVWLPSSYCHTEISETAWNTISGWLQGFSFRKYYKFNYERERIHEREILWSEKLCMCVTVYKLPSSSFIFDRMSS